MASPSLSDLRIDRPAVSHSSGRGWIVLLVLLLGGLAAAGAWWTKRAKAIEVHTVAVRELTAAVSERPTDRTVLNASGYVTARREATVSSKVTGKVMEVLVEEGMKVKENQILARLDDTNVRASLQLAMAQWGSTTATLEETRVRLQEAEKEFRRQSELLTKKIATQSDFDKAEASVLALRAKLRQQQADVAVSERTLSSWQQQWEDTIIRAPFNGVVTSKNAQPGEMISPMSSGGFTRTGICTIVDMDSLEIEIDVNESYINRVVPGQPVEATLDAYPEWKIPCKVIAIIPTADRQKSTVRVRVGFEKLDARILPEMSVKVGFREAKDASALAGAGTGGGTGVGTGTGAKGKSGVADAESSATEKQKSRGLVMPKEAVRRDGDRDIVFVVQNDRAERRAVTLAGENDNQVIASAGVTSGERVVIDQPKGLADGVMVKEVQE